MSARLELSYATYPQLGGDGRFTLICIQLSTQSISKSSEVSYLHHHDKSQFPRLVRYRTSTIMTKVNFQD